MTLTSALDLSLDQLAEALTACFEDYVMPARFSGSMVSSMMASDGYDLAASILARDEEGVIGATMISRRGTTARVAAMGVAKRARRQGVGRTMMEEAIRAARARGERKMELEVIEQNPAAVALYEAVGFTKAGRLVGLETTLANTSATLEEVSLEKVARALDDLDVPWQMSGATVRCFSMPTVGVKAAGVLAAVAPIQETHLLCRALTPASADEYRSFFEALCERYPGRIVRLPAYYPEQLYSADLIGAGLQETEISQFRMELLL